MDTMIGTAQDFGEVVRKARRAQGLTQRQLALVANVGERFIVELEAGKATCQLGKALMIAATLSWGWTWTSVRSNRAKAARRSRNSRKASQYQPVGWCGGVNAVCLGD